MTDSEHLRTALERAGITVLDTDLPFVIQRERLRPPPARPARTTEPALTPTVTRRPGR